jgi:hypothetical protein
MVRSNQQYMRGIVTAEPRRAISKWFDVAVFGVLVGYLCWCPLEANFTRASGVVLYIGLAVPGIVLGVFAVYLFVIRPCFGVLGRKLSWISAWLLSAYAMSYFINGGIKGPVEIARFWIFRLALVLLIGLVSYRLSRLGLLTLRTIAACSVFVAGLLMASMLAAIVLGIEPQQTNQEVTRVSVVTGVSVSGYSLAFALPGLAVMKRRLLRYTMIGLTLVAIAVTYRRGPMLCAAVAATLVVLIGYGDRLRTRVLGAAILAICILIPVTVIGAETLATRWIDFYEGTSRGWSMRDLIYPILAKGILDDTDCWLFGHGIGSTLVSTARVSGETVFAHNDWLEITYTTGLMGLIPFLLLHGLFLKVAWTLFHHGHKVFMIAAVAYTLFFGANIMAGVMYSAQEGGLLFSILGATCAWTDNGMDTYRGGCPACSVIALTSGWSDQTF